MSDALKEIEVINAEYGKGKDYQYKHSEGKKDITYTFVEAGATKCRVDGVWYISVFYRGTNDKLLRSTSADRWKARFKRVLS